MRNTTLAILASLLAAGTAAKADPAYRASDIVGRFAPAPDLGQSRALCIGTESECGKAVAAPPKPSNFDLVVNFEYNSATLTKSARENLDEFAKALRDPRLSQSAFEVGGYTDAKGGDSFNLDLSARRAGSVVEYLKNQGVDTQKLEARGYGANNPVSADPLDAANRRVETRLKTR